MKYLVTGANGNLATQIIWRLTEQGDEVVALDLAASRHTDVIAVTADITQGELVEKIVREHRPERIIHMASLLSVSSEARRAQAIAVNFNASANLMGIAAEHGVRGFFYPSTGATYGGALPDPLPEDFPQWPTNIYGVTKVAVERMGNYLAAKGELDFRSLRLPMVISPFAPTGAVSAYASHAFTAAVRGEPFSFPVTPEVGISTVYVADVVQGVLQLLDAPEQNLSQRVYNVHSFAPTAGDLANAIEERIPGFEYNFDPKEANMSVLSSLPSVHVDERARADWGWAPAFQLGACAEDMIKRLRE